MNCREMQEEFSALLDGELPPEARAAAEAHLSECADCLRELGKLKQVDTLYRQLPCQEAPPDFEERVGAQLRPELVQFRSRRLRQRRVWPMLAAAAMFLAVVGGTLLQTRKPSSRFEVASAPEKVVAPTTAVDVVDTVDAVDAEKEMPARGREVKLEEAVAAEPPAPTVALKPDYAAQDAAEHPRADIAKTEALNALGYLGDTESRRGIAAPEPAPPPSPLAESVSLGSPVASKSRASRMSGKGLEQRVLAGRTFELRDGGWRETGYEGRGRIKLARDSVALRHLIKRHAEVAALLELRERVIFRVERTWYEIEPALPAP